jgi:hypothetical protein
LSSRKASLASRISLFLVHFLSLDFLSALFLFISCIACLVPCQNNIMRAVAFLFATLSIAPCVHAAGLSIYDDSKTYAYQGCYNETTNLEDSSGRRALDGGITDVREGEMTVELCLDICGNGDVEYRFAGLQWARYVFHRNPSCCAAGNEPLCSSCATCHWMFTGPWEPMLTAQGMLVRKHLGWHC